MVWRVDSVYLFTSLVPHRTKAETKVASFTNRNAAVVIIAMQHKISGEQGRWRQNITLPQEEKRKNFQGMETKNLEI
jgi:hypothetical protein